MPILPGTPETPATGGAAELNGLILDDIIKRVQSKCDDPEGTYITAEYVLGFAQDAYETLYNKLRASGFQFDEQRAELPAVKAGSPNLDEYMKAGQPLVTLVKPRLVEWKMAGLPLNLYRVADGPLTAVRDLAPGFNYLDSWSWIRRSLGLSNFSVDLDFRVTGQFLFDPLVAAESPVEMDITLGPALALIITLAVAKARGNAGWITAYKQDLDDAVDELFIEMTKAQQAIPYRVGRMSRRSSNAGPGRFTL